MDFLIVWLLNGFALMLVAYLLKGVHIENYFSAFIAAAVLALVNTLVKPILVVLTIPITVLTLGLFLLVINGFLFWLVSKLLKGFEVKGTLSFFLGPILYSIISSVLSYIFLG
ncbi:phage holin family protein [Oligella ureolytica]